MIRSGRWSLAVIALSLIGAREPGVLTGAASGPTPTDTADVALLETSDVVLTGRVVRLDAGWDPQVTALYTYVTIDVTDVIKGRIADRHLVLKQLGGALADAALAVPAQPTFTAGENVLLFLEVRPRDGTLYTAGLWRGKWTITEDAQSGLPVAVRNHPPSSTSDRRDEARDLRAWRAFRAELVTASQSAAPTAVNAPVIGRPRDAVFETTTSDAVAPTTIPAFRWNEAEPLRVDAQVDGPPGKGRDGLDAIAQAIANWNDAGRSWRLAMGLTAWPCAMGFEPDHRITINFGQACGELSATGATPAVTGVYVDPVHTRTSGSHAVATAVHGFVLHGDSPSARTVLTTPASFAALETQELRYTIGLDAHAEPLGPPAERRGPRSVANASSTIGTALFGIPEQGPTPTPLCNQPLPGIAAPNAPHGIFVLQFPGQAINPAVLRNIQNQPTVCGGNLYIVWSQVDSGNGQYNWSTVDNLMAPWVAAGKSVNLIVWGVGDSAPNNATPAHVLSDAAYQSVSCANAGSATLYSYPVYYSAGYKNNYKTFIRAVLNHYGSNPNVGYIRFGVARGGEAFPTCLTQMMALGGYSTLAQFDTAWESYVAEMTAFQQSTLNSIAVSSGRVVQLMAALNQYGNPIQYNVTSFEAQNAVSLGFGFGSQGLQLSDIANYDGGNHCSSDWCANFVRFAGQVPLELQTIAASDPTNAAGGTGSITALLPFALRLHTQILEIYIQDLQVAYDPASPNYAIYSQSYQQAFQDAAAVVGGR